LALSSTTLLDVPLSASACVRASAVSASTRRASAAASSLLSSADAGLELVDAAGLKGARLGGEPVVQGLEIVAPDDLHLVLALELIDEPAQVVEPAALGARIDDADEHRAGLKLGSDRYRPQRPEPGLRSARAR
jgi:hypothetical protein